jgi:PD-(D/E)XK nuclease superfamily
LANIRPWSHSSLDAFVTCPRQYHEVKVLKSVVEEQSEEMRYGLYVHKAFEDYIADDDNAPLPHDLVDHRPFMTELLNQPGEHFAERKVGLNRQMQPCDFLAKDVWWRGIIDFTAISYQFAAIVDYKTGKPHNKFRQLKENALWIFAAHPEVTGINARYYWTKMRLTTEEYYRREQIPALWAELVPDLKQWVEAFKTDIWRPKPSGLCHGWCPVTDCEYWKPKRSK